MTTYGSGIASDSNDLWTQIDGYIQTTGWAVHDTVSNTSYKDRVYSSDGYLTTEKLFVRMRTGVTDEVVLGNTLKNSIYGDGYSNSVSFNMYQQWNTSANDGYSQIGQIGPRMIWARGTSTEVMVADFQHSKNGDWTTAVSGNLPFSPLNDQNANDAGMAAFDGHRYMYINMSPSRHIKYDFINDVSTTLTFAETLTAGKTLFPVYVYNATTDSEHVYHLTASTTSGQNFIRYNIATNDWVGRANPPWGALANDAGRMAWDGYDTIYATRGSSTTNFGYYSISGDTWTAGPAMPATVATGETMVFVPGDNTRPNRIYFTRGQATTFWSLDLNADGSPNGTWAVKAVTPATVSYNAKVCYIGNDYITLFPRSIPQAIARYNITSDTWTDKDGTTGVYYDIWGLQEDINYGSSVSPQKRNAHIPIKEGTSAQFWFFGDADRIAIVIKDANDVYDYIYMGTIDSYYTRASTLTTSTITAGINAIVTVDDGYIFTQGQNVTLYSQTTDAQVITHTGLDGYARNFMATEIATIDSVSGNTLYLTKSNNTYPVGTKIAVDPAPYAVTAFRANEAQMNNFIPTANASGITDAYLNQNNLSKIYVYECPASSELTGQSSEEARTGQYCLWPITIRSRYDGTAPEVRGQFKGVYIIGNTGSVTSGDIVTFQGNNYMVFSLPNYLEDMLFAFGPIA